MYDKILFLDKPTNEFLAEYRQKFSKIDHWYTPSEITVIYTHYKSIAWERYPKLKFVLCPCTGILHLGEIPKGIEIFYLDDKPFMFNNIFSTANWAMLNIMQLLMMNNEELTNKIVGIIGVGRIGQQLAPMIMNYRGHILSWDKGRVAFNYNYIPDLGELFKKSDIITVHLTENDGTKGIIGKSLFEKTTKCPYFLNCSRSSIVNGESLMNAYYGGAIHGMAIDVYEDYSEEIKSQLFELSATDGSNVIVTDHIAGKSNHSRVETDKYVLRRFIECIQI